MAKRVTRRGQKTPDAADAAVGVRIRGRREKLGLSQTGLGNRIGVTFQQIQKYESNKNRVSMGRLLRIAPVLGVSVTYLLTGSEEKRGQRGDDEGAVLLRAPGALRLIKAFDRMKNGEARAALITLSESIARIS
jgi:transcriptional regulator with XRE-family HTH domain